MVLLYSVLPVNAYRIIRVRVQAQAWPQPTKKNHIHAVLFSWWARRDLNPQSLWEFDFKSNAYTNSATRPKILEAPTGNAPVYAVLQTAA